MIGSYPGKRLWRFAGARFELKRGWGKGGERGGEGGEARCIYIQSLRALVVGSPRGERRRIVDHEGWGERSKKKGRERGGRGSLLTWTGECIGSEWKGKNWYRVPAASRDLIGTRPFFRGCFPLLLSFFLKKGNGEAGQYHKWNWM